MVWTIYRYENGPENAYKTFGEDLMKSPPSTTNENIVSQTSAIVRSTIANKEIDEVFKQRNVVREEIKAQLHE